MELYFKCSKCGHIYNKDNKKKIKNKDIKVEKDSYICDSCKEYIIWELKEYG